ALERVDDALAGTDEERHHEVAEVEPRLAHEGAQARGPAQTPQPGGGEASCAHGFGSCCGTKAESVLRALRRNRTRSELMRTIYAFRFAPRARRARPDRRARARWGAQPIRTPSKPAGSSAICEPQRLAAAPAARRSRRRQASRR